MTQESWAGLLGVSRATLKRWEADEAVPGADAEARIVEACRDRGLFRSFARGPLQGITVTPEFLRDLFAETRLGTGPPRERRPGRAEDEYDGSLPSAGGVDRDIGSAGSRGSGGSEHNHPEEPPAAPGRHGVLLRRPRRRTSCQQCGFGNSARMQFCGRCAAPIAAAPRDAERAGPHHPTGSSRVPPADAAGAPAERRQLTVLVCDLLDAARLSARLDLEQFRDVLQAYWTACVEIIEQFEGYVAGKRDERLLAYFSYPSAHEDDARRAVLAGLEIIGSVAALSTRFQRKLGCTLAVRVSVHTGLVIADGAGDGDRREPVAIVGEAPMVAAHLLDDSGPGSIVISHTTYRLVEGYFVCRPLGERVLDGIAEPISTYAVLRPTGARGWLDRAGSARLTPLVGREQELGMLWERWGRAKEGAGQVVLLSGEPGVGKTRLVQTLESRVSVEPHLLLEAGCSPYHQHSAFHPVIELLERSLGFEHDEAAPARLKRLERWLDEHDLAAGATVSLLTSLLSINPAEPHTPLDAALKQQREQTLEAVLLVLFAVAAQRPLLLVIEDLHWSDASTLELLDLLVDQVPTVPILVVLTFRPDFTPRWPRAHVTHLTLSRLPHGQAEMMIERVAGSKRLPAAMVQRIAARTDGIPLFVEELTKTVLESGMLEERGDRYELRGLLPALVIPATLRDSLMARLDRLGRAKLVAQWGATIGREFSYELLHTVAPFDTGTLQHALGRLVQAELLYQRGVPPRVTYQFKHALVQEAAYESLLQRKRRESHRRIAEALVDRFPEAAETQPEVVALHYTEAGLEERAIEYWRRAGQRAIERSAGAEAIAHLNEGLELLKHLPETPDRLRQELELQSALGLVQTPITGYGSVEVERAYGRALELCRQIGETPRLFSVLRGLWELYDLRGDTRRARELAEELVRLASAEGDAGLRAVAHNALGETLVWPGEFALARRHLEQGIACSDPLAHRRLAFVHGGYDAGVICRIWAGHVLWYLGYPDQALARCREALTLARELSHAHTLTFALAHAAVLHQFRREAPAALEHAEAAIALATEQGFTFWIAFAGILRGWALAEQGQGSEGIDEIHRGITGYRTSGAELELPLWLALLAVACAATGHNEDGLAAVSEGLAVANRHGIHFFDAELHRLRGELLLQASSNASEAEACFRRAIDVARAQQAKSLELRAAMSLARLWRRRGERPAAYALLADVSGWFTEGRDTDDLQAAKSLLEEL